MWGKNVDVNESREEAGRRAEQRAKELSELRLRLSAGGLLTADDIELAQRRADEAQQRAKAAHLSAAQRHEEARRTHERAAEATSVQLMRGSGTVPSTSGWLTDTAWRQIRT